MTDFLVKHFVKNYTDTEDIKVRENYGTMAGITGIVCNIFLFVLKFAVGTLSGSISVLSDAFNNLSDSASCVVTLFGCKMAAKPADKDHPFGHGRMEYMSAFIVAVLILLVGTELLKSSLKAIIKGDAAPVYSAYAIAVLAVSMLIKLWMYIFNRKLFKRVESGVFKATALDSLNDIMSTGAILLSVAVSLCFKLPFNLDAVMGLLVSLFILYSGFATGRDTLNLILGNPPDEDTVEEIKNTVLSFEGFIGIHDLMVHNYGPGRQFASVHVEVPQDSDFVKCHEQADLCERLINEKYNIQLVIHMDPIDTNSPAVKTAREAMTAELKKIDENMSLHDFRMTPLSDKRTNLIFDAVIPPEYENRKEELRQRISDAAKSIDKTYFCVITFDIDFTGHN